MFQQKKFYDIFTCCTPRHCKRRGLTRVRRPDIKVIKVVFTTSLTLRQNKLERFHIKSLSSQMQCLPVRKEHLSLSPNKGKLLALLANISIGLKGLSRKNALAFCISSSVMKKKSFITLTPGGISTVILFSLVTDAAAK